MTFKKIFSKQQIGKHKVINIFGIKIKITKNDCNINAWSFRYIYYKFLKSLSNGCYATGIYLSRYKYAADLAKKELESIPENEKNKLTGKFWTMWLQDDIPEPIQMCLDSIKRIYPDIIMITEKNLHEYVEVPAYMSEKYKKGIIQPMHYSDWIRMYLLDKYGGTWIDASLLMLDKVPEFILKQPFFILQTPARDSISNFFIHSGTNNLITKTIKIFLEEYWKHENITIDYVFYHYFFKYICEQNKNCRELYNNIIPYPNSSIRYLTDNIYLNADKDAWDYLSKNCFMYKFNRKSKAAVKNPNSWYNFLLNKYRKGELLSNIDSTAV